MQSTKKAPLRKEDGTTAAGDDVATIAQSAGPNATQPVSYESIKVLQILYCKLLLYYSFGVSMAFLPITVLLALTLLCLTLFSYPPPITSCLILSYFVPNS